MSYRSAKKMYRIPQEGKFMGVCAGVADYFSINLLAVRVLTVIATLMTGFWFALAYVVLGFALDPKPQGLFEEEASDEYWSKREKRHERRASKSRAFRKAEAEMTENYSVDEMRRRFGDIERRTADMEAYMTSKRFRLERELKALED